MSFADAVVAYVALTLAVLVLLWAVSIPLYIIWLLTRGRKVFMIRYRENPKKTILLNVLFVVWPIVFATIAMIEWWKGEPINFWPKPIEEQ